MARWHGRPSLEPKLHFGIDVITCVTCMSQHLQYLHPGVAITILNRVSHQLHQQFDVMTNTGKCFVVKSYVQVNCQLCTARNFVCNIVANFIEVDGFERSFSLAFCWRCSSLGLFSSLAQTTRASFEHFAIMNKCFSWELPCAQSTGVHCSLIKCVERTNDAFCSFLLILWSHNIYIGSLIFGKSLYNVTC